VREVSLRRTAVARQDQGVDDEAEALRVRAHRAVLAGLCEGRSLSDIEREVATCRVRGTFTPDVAMLELIAAALDVAQVSPQQPRSTAGWRQKYLPEVDWRRDRRSTERIVYALQTAGALRTGLRPDILDDTYHWSATPLWPYALLAAIMTIRATSDGKDLAQVCTQLQGCIPDFHE
jgi:hypothetical protein